MCCPENRTRVAALQTLSQLGERGAAFATELEPLLDDVLPVSGQNGGRKRCGSHWISKTYESNIQNQS